MMKAFAVVVVLSLTRVQSWSETCPYLEEARSGLGILGKWIAGISADIDSGNDSSQTNPSALIEKNWFMATQETKQKVQAAILDPGSASTCCLVKGTGQPMYDPPDCAPSARRPLRYNYRVAVTTHRNRLFMAEAMVQSWIGEFDHLIATELGHKDWTSPGLRWGSAYAHRAIAAIICAGHPKHDEKKNSASSSPSYDFLILADDDTFIRIDKLDAALSRIKAQPRIPVMLGGEAARTPQLEQLCQRCFSNMSKPCIAQAGERTGWNYGGYGIVLSKAAVDIVVNNAETCIRKHTCPIKGTPMGDPKKIRTYKADQLLLKTEHLSCKYTDTSIASCLKELAGIVALELDNPKTMGGFCPWTAHPREYKHIGCHTRDHFNHFITQHLVHMKNCCEPVHHPINRNITFDHLYMGNNSHSNNLNFVGSLLERTSDGENRIKDYGSDRCHAGRLGKIRISDRNTPLPTCQSRSYI
uniref:Hexosyltransferase n=1 Tax=Aureoumbra lagunensis TaxID=44058 RepID=A0A7S3K2X7_9STRA|mmetsp:Transcript_13220/g.17644  ORF Transcript_13220/g.17644 Transcript_13220/m.17644 type:complete len:471 (+) Transcript_13220:142-1554(+)